MATTVANGTLVISGESPLQSEPLRYAINRPIIWGAEAKSRVGMPRPDSAETTGCDLADSDSPHSLTALKRAKGLARRWLVARLVWLHRFRVRRSTSAIITQDSRTDYDPIFPYAPR